MALEDDQRTWLNAALRGKGRIKSVVVKKQFDNYKRRRAKVDAVFQALPSSHVNYILIKGGLAAADKQAEAGGFKAAYSSLDQIKRLAKVSDPAEAADILDNEVRQSAELIKNLVAAQVVDLKGCFASIDAAVTAINDLEACSDQPTLQAALAHYKEIVKVETSGAIDAAISNANAAHARLLARKIDDKLTEMETEFTRLRNAGHNALVQQHEGMVADARTKLASDGGKYADASQLLAAIKTLRQDTDATLKARKHLGAYKDTEWPGMELHAREEARMDIQRAQYLKELEKDQDALSLKGGVDLELTPEQPEFDTGGFVDGINIDVDGALTPAEIAQAVTGAGNMMSDLLKDDDTPQSVLLDLISKDQKALRADLLAKLFPGLKEADLSDPQKDARDQLSKEMFDKINAESPNKVTVDEDGPKSISVGGVNYEREKVLKAGGLGTATLFTDPETGKKMVLKTPNDDDPGAFEDLLKEMKVMNRVQEGASTGPNGSPAPEFFGAARGEDGSMHCMMEFIDGGDMEEVSRSMNAAANSGFLPAAARTAMQADMVGKAAKALGELQRQGLLHHDIKELNVMMTKSGDVRIIDYGESVFVNEDGKTGGDNKGNATPGYLPDDGFGAGATVEADTFSLGSMLLSMAGETKVDRWNANEPDGGALGRLITALHDDPGKRVSLEGMAQSAFMTAADTDFGPEAMDSLRTAATQFAQDTRSLKSEMSVTDIEAGMGNMEEYEGFFPPDKRVGLDDAQGFVALVDQDMAKIQRAMHTNPDKLTPEELEKIPQTDREAANDAREKLWLDKNRDTLAKMMKAKAFIQAEVINGMMDKAVTNANAAYEAALNNDTKTVPVTVMGQTKTLTLKEAVDAHADLITEVAARRKDVVEWLQTAAGEDDEIQRQLASRNEDLVTMDGEAKTLQAQIEQAAGPEASLHFSKARLDAATVPFGPTPARRSRAEMEADGLEAIEALGKTMRENHDTMLKKAGVNIEIEENAADAAE